MKRRVKRHEESTLEYDVEYFRLKYSSVPREAFNEIYEAGFYNGWYAGKARIYERLEKVLDDGRDKGHETKNRIRQKEKRHFLKYFRFDAYGKEISGSNRQLVKKYRERFKDRPDLKGKSLLENWASGKE